MSFAGLNLTKRQPKNCTFNFPKILNFAFNFTENALFSFKKCRNYTIDNFTNR
jgi:hypothetical protein